MKLVGSIDNFFANLPFNPSLMGQLGPMHRALVREMRLRRLGFYLLCGLLVLQLFMFMRPAENSLQYGPDYLIQQPRTAADVVRAWDQDERVRATYEVFGLTREDLTQLPQRPKTVINSRDSSYWVASRSALTAGAKTNRISFEDSLHELVYISPLDSFNQRRPISHYRAFEGKKSNGELFWILADSGNYVQKQVPHLSEPRLEIYKQLYSAKQQPQIGDQVTIRYLYRNSQPGSLATNISIEDQIDPEYFLARSSSEGTHFGNTFQVPIGSLAYSQNFHVIERTGEILANKPLHTLCSQARLLEDIVTRSSTPETPAGARTCSNAISGPVGLRLSQVTDHTSGELQPNNEVEYELAVIRTNSDQPTYTIEHYIGDLLEYADLSMDNLAARNGQYIESRKTITWYNQPFDDSDVIKQTFRIIMKSPITATNNPGALSVSYDCAVTNVYGNQLSLPVACPLIKEIEELPVVRGVIALIATGLLTALSGIGLLRVRLLDKELRTLKKEYVAKGGAS
jgi:hypothetical protein